MRKYTEELLREHAAQSSSVCELMRRLKLKLSGGSHTYITGLLKKFGIDCSHFKGQAAHSGQRSNGNKRSWKSVLVVKSGDRRAKTYQIRRALIESGTEELCALCGIGPTWNGKNLVLQVDHMNGDGLDNRRENLRFLCPNCHSQTDNWSSKNHKGPP